MRLALHLDEPVERVISRLAARGVRLSADTSSGMEQGSTVIEDLDGNPIERVEQGALPPKEKEEAAAMVSRAGAIR